MELTEQRTRNLRRVLHLILITYQIDKPVPLTFKSRISPFKGLVATFYSCLSSPKQPNLGSKTKEQTSPLKKRRASRRTKRYIQSLCSRCLCLFVRIQNGPRILLNNSNAHNNADLLRSQCIFLKTFSRIVFNAASSLRPSLNISRAFASSTTLTCSRKRVFVLASIAETNSGPDLLAFGQFRASRRSSRYRLFTARGVVILPSLQEVLYKIRLLRGL
mmetsp:Transcript_48097/g.79987  ORF Transcript_48097/g.79987 Transcript_48097/m.79987 type:complete len:218 (-) Transcript_48097:57-710(-)